MDKILKTLLKVALVALPVILEAASEALNGKDGDVKK